MKIRYLILAIGFMLLVTGPLHAHYPGDTDVTSADTDASPRTIPPSHKLFTPLMADPQELKSQLSVVQATLSDSSPGNFTGAFISMDVGFPLYNSNRTIDRGTWDLRLVSGIHSQFNIDKSSNDLLNTDFLVGFPLSYRDGEWAARLRVMHQSSHLGDEFILSGNAPNRVNLSFEFAELLLAYHFGEFRIYAGGSHAFHRQPESLKPNVRKGGIEYIDEDSPWLMAVHVTQHQETDWKTEFNAQAGVRVEPVLPGTTQMDIYLQAFDGPFPYGQFYTQEAEYYGISFKLDI